MKDQEIQQGETDKSFSHVGPKIGDNDQILSFHDARPALRKPF